MAAEDKDITFAMENAAKDTRDGQKAVGLMNAAARAASDKNFSKAASLYESVANDKGISKDLRDISKILYVRTLQLTKDENANNYTMMAELLEPIANADRSPFNTLAKVEVATLYGSGLNNPAKAVEFLKDLNQTSQISDSLKEKALALKRIYTYETSKDTK